MLWWLCASFLFVLGGLRVIQLARHRFQMSPSARRVRDLDRVSRLLHEIQDLLRAGIVPQKTHWERLRILPDPWGSLCFENLSQLRERGQSLLPTIARLKAFVVRRQARELEARAKLSQAWAQVIASGAIVPVLSLTLFSILPGVSEAEMIWWGVTAVALALGGLAMLWIFKISDHARWGGLISSRRIWVLVSQVACERMIGLVRAGTPSDLAWANVMQSEGVRRSKLDRLWGNSVFSAPAPQKYRSSERLIADFGHHLRQSITIAVMEGSGSIERMEAALEQFDLNWQAEIERHLQLIGTRALRPLFFCVAPSILILMGAGFWLSFRSQGFG